MFSQQTTQLVATRLAGVNDLSGVLARVRLDRPTLAEQLQWLLKEKGLKRARVIAEANLDATHGYQIFVGQRGASRDKLLALCIAMGLSVEETDSVLRSGGVNELFVGDRRDLIVIFGLVKSHSLQQIQENLYHYGEAPLN